MVTHIERKENVYYNQFNSSKNFGLQAEKVVKEWLEELGKTVVDSSAEENIKLDIDIYVDGVASSIKAISYNPRRKNRPGFELAVLQDGEWRHSWFVKGQAKAYFYISYEKDHVDLWYINKSKLIKLYREKGFDFVTGLTESVKKSQVYHKHKDTRCGFYNFETLVEAGAGKLIGTKEFPRETNSAALSIEEVYRTEAPKREAA